MPQRKPPKGRTPRKGVALRLKEPIHVLYPSTGERHVLYPSAGELHTITNLVDVLAFRDPQVPVFWVPLPSGQEYPLAVHDKRIEKVEDIAIVDPWSDWTAEDIAQELAPWPKRSK